MPKKGPRDRKKQDGVIGHTVARQRGKAEAAPRATQLSWILTTYRFGRVAGDPGEWGPIPAMNASGYRSIRRRTRGMTSLSSEEMKDWDLGGYRLLGRTGARADSDDWHAWTVMGCDRSHHVRVDWLMPDAWCLMPVMPVMPDAWDGLGEVRQGWIEVSLCSKREDVWGDGIQNDSTALDYLVHEGRR